MLNIFVPYIFNICTIYNQYMTNICSCDIYWPYIDHMWWYIYWIYVVHIQYCCNIPVLPIYVLYIFNICNILKYIYNIWYWQYSVRMYVPYMINICTIYIQYTYHISLIHWPYVDYVWYIYVQHLMGRVLFELPRLYSTKKWLYNKRPTWSFCKARSTDCDRNCFSSEFKNFPSRHADQFIRISKDTSRLPSFPRGTSSLFSAGRIFFPEKKSFFPLSIISRKNSNTSLNKICVWSAFSFLFYPSRTGLEEATLGSSVISGWCLTKDSSLLTDMSQQCYLFILNHSKEQYKGQTALYLRSWLKMKCTVPSKPLSRL